MMKPCIRSLKEFKKGCPENNACPAWVTTLGKLQPRIINKCADIVMVDLLWDLNCNTIGTQAATESFRNGMCEVVVENGHEVVRPKINQLVVQAAQGAVRVLKNPENLKRLESGGQ